MPNMGDVFPLQPFDIPGYSLTKSVTQAYTAGALTKLTFDIDSVYWDKNNNIFKPLLPGMYSFALALTTSATNTNITKSAWIYKNGVKYITLFSADGQHVANYTNLSYNIPIYLDTTDYLEFYFNFGGTNANITTSTSLVLRRWVG